MRMGALLLANVKVNGTNSVKQRVASDSNATLLTADVSAAVSEVVLFQLAKVETLTDLFHDALN
jgi:hypothetical protein